MRPFAFPAFPVAEGCGMMRDRCDKLPVRGKRIVIKQQCQSIWRRLCIGLLWLAMTSSAALSAVAIAVESAADAGSAIESAAEAPDPAQQQMNALGEQALASGLQLIERSGGLYPYAMVVSGEQAQLMSYQGDPDARPPEQEWSALLLQRLRNLAETDETVTTVALVRLHQVPTRSGDGHVQGLWVLLDHRELRPTLLFLPFLPGEDGQHRMGELLYYGSEQHIFPFPIAE